MMDVGVNSTSQDLLVSALRAAERRGGMAFEKSANKAMWYTLRSGAAAAKPKSMRGKRELVRRSTIEGGSTKGQSRYLIRVLRQDKGPTFIPTNRVNDPRRNVTRLGLASAVFRAGGSSFGKLLKSKTVRGVRRFFRTHQTRTTHHLALRFEAALSYLERAFPGIADIALRKGLTSFIREFDRDWATAMKEAKWA